MKTRYLRLVKKQRGFTLIELLAVILILGIIALIAIPTVSSVVEQSRKGSAESSASQFVTSVGELIMTTELQGTKLPDGLYSSEQLQAIGLNIKGTMPDDGYVLIEDGEVVGCNLNYGNYNVTCDGSNFNSSKKEETPKFTIVYDADSNGEVSLKDKVCIDTECFYVVGFEGDNVRLLTEWNLNVGYDITYNGSYEMKQLSSYSFSEELGMHYDADYLKISDVIQQDKERRGYIYDSSKKIYSYRGVTNFAYISKNNFDNKIDNGYWVDSNKNILSKYGSSYPSYVYDDNVIFSKYIDNYVDNLKIKYGQNIISGNLIKQEELVSLGCDESKVSCKNAPEWVYQTSYWTGSASSSTLIWYVRSSGNQFTYYCYYWNYDFGIRPVITIAKSQIAF